MARTNQKSTVIKWIVAAAILIGLWFAWQQLNPEELSDDFASGNGRIEATEINVAAKYAGRLEEVLVEEGDFVHAGQALAKMQITTLEAQHDEARAVLKEAKQTVATALAQIALRESELAAAKAVVKQREADLGARSSRYERSRRLSREGAASKQELDDDRAQLLSAEAAVVAAKAQVIAATAAVDAAKSEQASTESRVQAAEATVARIVADIEDSTLVSPRDGRVQIRLAEPGEVLAAGGRVINLVDLADVSMTFFLPEMVAGRLAIGSEARLVLDAAPNIAIPAYITFVASTAQFTPKTVETASERQKLMFRVKAQIPAELLQQYLEYVKTGLPGEAFVKVNPEAEWPAHLQTRRQQRTE